MSSRRGGRSQEPAKKSFWSMSIGRSGAPDEEVVEQEEFHRHLPGVNLLPRRVTESIAIAKSRTVLLLTIVLLAAVTAALWWLQGDAIAQAERTLAESQSRNDDLSAQVAALAPAKNFYNEVATLEELVSSTLADQPQARAVLVRLDQALTAGAGGSVIDVQSASITYDGVPEPGGELTSCPNPDPFSTEITIGCLTFSATAANRAQVSDLLRAMEVDPLFVGPFVTSTTATGSDSAEAGKVTFTGSAGISPDGLQTPLTAEQIELLENPPTAEEDGTDGASGDGVPDGTDGASGEEQP